MMKLKKTIALILCSILVISTVSIVTLADTDTKQLDVLFTHDTHSHMLPVNDYQNGSVTSTGGYARLKTALDVKRAENSNTITLDAGDFSVGSLFQTLGTTKAPELCALGDMGYDVVTAGNHEFDFGDEGFADMLNAAKAQGGNLPQFVMSNYTIPTDENGNYDELGLKIESAINNYGVKDYTVVQKGNVNVAVFGLMGNNAYEDIQNAEMQFEDATQAAKDTVAEIKANEPDVDMIICLSHTGTNEDPDKSEDENLAKAVPDIDLIISGHTHTVLEQPKVIGNTYIVSAGCYAQYLGEINMVQDSTTKRWRAVNYDLTPINETIPDNEDIASEINDYKTLVQSQYLDNFNLGFDQVIAYSPYNFTSVNDLGKGVEENPLGDLLSDSYRYAVKQATGTDVDFAAIPYGTMRASFVEGDITTSDVFNTNSLGIGSDGVQGYPVLEFYIKGSDLKTVCEIDASISKIMPEACLYMSGLNYTYNPYRMFLDKVTDVRLQQPDGTEVAVDDDKLYSCAVGWYTAAMLSSVKDLSYGIIDIPLYDANGNQITDTTFQNQIVTQDGKQLKEWQATAEYLQSFDKVDGVSTIPAYYSSTHDRKTVDNSNNLGAILKNPGITTIVILIAFIIVIVLALLIVIVLSKVISKSVNKRQNR